MPDDSATTSLDQKVTAFLKKVEDRVAKDFKIDRGWLRENLKTVVRRRVYAGEHGPIRVLKPGSMGEFYVGAVDDADIMAPLIHEIVEAAPEEVKMEHLREREERVAELQEEKARNPQNWF